EYDSSETVFNDALFGTDCLQKFISCQPRALVLLLAFSLSSEVHGIISMILYVSLKRNFRFKTDK
ncbi:hypothetical protein KI387_006673, partial [Taxus chinensis]